MMEKPQLFDSLEVVVKDRVGRVKDVRLVKRFGGKIWEFRPNFLYLRLTNAGSPVWKIPGLFGSWSVVNA